MMSEEQDKRKELNYRQVDKSASCLECKHWTRKTCSVMGGPIHVEMRCDAWNDRERENTWHLLVYPIRDKILILAKEEKTVLARGTMELPVESVDIHVISLIEAITKTLGCPDYLINISPRKYQPGEFKDWMEKRGLQYRELDLMVDKMEIPVEGDEESPLDVLSRLVEEALSAPY